VHKTITTRYDVAELSAPRGDGAYLEACLEEATEMPLSSSRRWGMLPAPVACHKSRAMPGCRARVYTARSPGMGARL